jgi:hypothetical protein
VKYGWVYWRFPIQNFQTWLALAAAARCNREVGSQIENLRVVIVITGQRFILLDSFLAGTLKLTSTKIVGFDKKYCVDDFMYLVLLCSCYSCVDVTAVHMLLCRCYCVDFIL